MPTIETIPEMYNRISRLNKEQIKEQCSTMSLGQITPLIYIAEKNKQHLFSACLCERFADLQTNPSHPAVKNLMIYYYEKSSQYFILHGYAFEESRVRQKADALRTPGSLVQPHSGALFSAPANNTPKDGRHNPYAPVLEELW